MWCLWEATACSISPKTKDDTLRRARYLQSTDNLGGKLLCQRLQIYPKVFFVHL